ncbi:NAD(P)-dependent dehydrogenase (short-subunit alcohol dehydrogenase family) [Kibdelosporangium banguiense]|uniref:NAD(P)-dependent dehydrogenase (Short-subunit alcohol dehydrogenase family) n=1 Tax=Kibdelosporangium banguiense TaxID=1365924 RepID=A0ABS4TU29_9PSEU|nr:SDR family oxidoreductase [Kibdelosporangium banguiense]MBP2327880.1 NAD(P)-dependent dehydrogenase (short-subunit alcohol dehydrogenase family) [Kibdelosporangium banguiense]
MKSTFDAQGEVLLVTGGANGIGAATARAFAERGGTAVVFDVAPAEDLDDRIEHHRVDVSDREAVLHAVDAVLDKHGRIDALVAGAAVQPRCDVVGMDAHTWRQTLAVNLDGVVWCCQAVLPDMIARRSGSIVVFSSGLAHAGRAQAAAYAASKGALISFAKSLAAEVADYRVRVNTVFPGVIDTPQFRAANPSGGEREHWAATTGIGSPEDVVGCLLFLLSDAATMTGSTLTRDRAFAQEAS